MAPSQVTWLEIARAIWRLAGSAAVAVAFLFLLAVASAQQEAIKALDATNAGLSYSVARDVVRKADADRADQQRLKNENVRLRADARAFGRQKYALSGDLYARLEDVDLIARSIMRSGQCDALPAGTSLPAVPDLALWRNVQLCAQQGNIPAPAAKAIKELHAPGTNPATIQRQIDDLDRDIKENTDSAASNDADIDRLSKSVASADLVRNALQDVRIFDENGLIRTFRLTSLPPRVLPIFLSFFAGMFGALLITLVLVVYPNNDLNLTGSNSFWYRIGLGGLIAVAIYVVLGGGLAMIGSNDAVAIGDTNFMFFCAVGILAGMFSDRAAGFLSDSASTFSGAAVGRPAPAPATPPASPLGRPPAGRAPAADEKGKDDESS